MIKLTPFFKNDEIKINYEITGEGKPLVLIQGLAEKMSGWDFQIQFFKQRMKVIWFDNRGVGKSSRPNYPYTMEMFVNDTKSLLDYLNITEKIHLCGFSMGGMIAQNFILKYPERIKSLILLASSAKTEPSYILENVTRLEKESEDKRLWSNFAVYFSKNFRDKIRQDKNLLGLLKSNMLTDPTRAQDYANQIAAIKKHDTTEVLHKIKHPTLIIGSTEDLLLSLPNSKLLHEKIPNSIFEILEGAGHYFNIEVADKVNKIIWDFVKNHL